VKSKTLTYFTFALLVGLIAVVRPQRTPARSLATLSGPFPFFLPLIYQSPSGHVSGVILDQDGPLVGATVRVQATLNQTLSDEQGRFTLYSLPINKPVTISAWKDGYYCAKITGILPEQEGISLSMRRYQTNDNPAYTWIPPVGDISCASCKVEVTKVWIDNDAHARAAVNPRFLTMYNGTDVYGNQSPLTRYLCTPDYGCFPLPPDPNQPYYGPGYKLDFPETAGNCAACHTPGAAVDAPYQTDPNAVSGADLFGVHCDFCHKIADVRLDAFTGLPYPNTPGVLSMDIRRPFPEDPERYQLFFGTFDDDNVPEEDTYLPLIRESQFCAPCHFSSFWDTLVYNSYGEWLDSPYSDPGFPGAKTCQACHMPAPTIVDGMPLTNVATGKGGVERDPLTIHAHTFPGASNQELLQNSVAMTVTTQVQDGTLAIQVEILNDRTGHDVPTDSPLRQLILLIDARDSQGQVLTLQDGPTIPDWGGVGDPAQGYYAGLPGTAYAKILEEIWTGVSPSGAYWNPTRVVSDNRIPAFARATSAYSFALPQEGSSISVDVQLLYRRAFITLRDQKSWDIDDILMERHTFQVDIP
jgi:hypothetical protein